MMAKLGGSLTWLEVPIESKSGRSTNLSLCCHRENTKVWSSDPYDHNADQHPHQDFQLNWPASSGAKNASDPHIDWDDQAREHLFLSLWRGVRHETGERSMIKVGLTSHPGIKRIKPRVYYAAPKTLLLCWSTVAPLYWFFKWGLIGSDPPDPSTKYLRF